MKIYLDTIGCRLNQSEIEAFALQFRAEGHQLVSSPEQAELVVVNTCTVTAAAASDSRQKIRRAAKNGNARIVVTGCWATLEPASAASLPGVTQVVDNLSKDLLVPIVLKIAPKSHEPGLLARQPIPGVRQRTRAFIKVQDGCNNRCSFCITRIARGPSRSRAIGDVLRDIYIALSGGAQEIVLTGVHLGAWGADFSSRRDLTHLVQTVLVETNVPRLRLSSLDAWDLPPAFFDLWQDPRLCRHLHLPLQSGSAATLRRMARRTTPESFAHLVQTARAAIPGVAITTDVLVGFPGESDVEFEESLRFVSAMEFAGGHVFTYSERPGTPAACFPEIVPHSERKQRNARMRSVLAQAEIAYQRSFLGKQLEVLWESVAPHNTLGWELNGLTDNYLRVQSHAPERLWNRVTPVILTDHTPHGLIGTLVS